jgi:hypothetical protein
LLSKKNFLQIIPESRRRVSSTSVSERLYLGYQAQAGSRLLDLTCPAVQAINRPAIAGGFGPFVTIEEVS